MNNFLNDDDFYHLWNQNIVIADCLKKLGFNAFALQVHTQPYDKDIINSFIKLIQKTALRVKDNDVLDRLYFAGLIYG